MSSPSCFLLLVCVLAKPAILILNGSYTEENEYPLLKQNSYCGNTMYINVWAGTEKDTNYHAFFLQRRGPSILPVLLQAVYINIQYHTLHSKNTLMYVCYRNTHSFYTQRIGNYVQSEDSNL
jgi:hypothetical protein